MAGKRKGSLEALMTDPGMPLNQSETPKISNDGPHNGSIPQNPIPAQGSQAQRHFLGGRQNAPHGNRDQARFELARTAVESGMPVNKAMLAAGYSENTVKGHSKYPVKQALGKFRDNFLLKFSKRLRKRGLDGDGMAERIANIVEKPDDYNAIQAMRLAATIMLRNAPAFDSTTGIMGIFVVPESKAAETWESEARQLQDVQVSSLIRDAEIVENPVDKEPLL